jgi:hypothetical protein
VGLVWCNMMVCEDGPTKSIRRLARMEPYEVFVSQLSRRFSTKQRTKQRTRTSQRYTFAVIHSRYTLH